ncbi:VWA domain-containing protein [Ramlibacter sp. USB13]|uniref:VWA domain-containing protein n=1 Tax=Ramlibacter cellulosilyticus TaxID=2764187 RepID=A0A923MUB5_9BURK|nr:VWA domain-containing protein [Ramlibacter cellulosilyticus]MBC5785166.1 VWA domain-containing protein [Ramlibacter cellulosilyticus]
MRHRPPSRSLVALLCAQCLLAACSATAQGLWPEPRPQPQPQPWSEPRSVPNFQAPSATHCTGPIRTREVPGWTESSRQRGRFAPDAAADVAPERSARADNRMREAAPPSASAAAPLPAPAPAAPLAQRGPQAPSHDFVARPQPWQPVTAGVVDDNADFSGYLAFRERTQVAHRPRDVRERYLLQVKDGRGRPVGDAEVAVQGTSGYAMWARTDAGGRAWLHPAAFDPAGSGSYQVLVRKDGRQARGQLARGQKSAVDVRLDAPPAPARARLDLLFLIDATGSMADEIDKLKATLHTITAEVANLPSRPDLCLGLVAYRDRGDAFLLRSHDFSNDVGAFLREALLPLQAGGGGDYPEAMNEALHEAVHEASWRGSGTTRMVILLADAPPHLDYGGPQYDDDMLAALGKGIKVFSVGASGLDRQGEYIQRQVAQYTGGKFVFLTYAQADRPGSGPGRETVHDVRNYSVDTLDRLIVRLVTEELALSGN